MNVEDLIDHNTVLDFIDNDYHPLIQRTSTIVREAAILNRPDSKGLLSTRCRIKNDHKLQFSMLGKTIDDC